MQRDVLHFRQQGFILLGGDFNARTGLRTEQLGYENEEIRDFARVWGAPEEELAGLLQAEDFFIDRPPPSRLSEDASGIGDGRATEAFLQLCNMHGGACHCEWPFWYP